MGKCAELDVYGSWTTVGDRENVEGMRAVWQLDIKLYATKRCW